MFLNKCLNVHTKQQIPGARTQADRNAIDAESSGDDLILQVRPPPCSYLIILIARVAKSLSCQAESTVMSAEDVAIKKICYDIESLNEE